MTLSTEAWFVQLCKRHTAIFPQNDFPERQNKIMLDLFCLFSGQAFQKLCSRIASRCRASRTLVSPTIRLHVVGSVAKQNVTQIASRTKQVGGVSVSKRNEFVLGQKQKQILILCILGKKVCQCKPDHCSDQNPNFSACRSVFPCGLLTRSDRFYTFAFGRPRNRLDGPSPALGGHGPKQQRWWSFSADGIVTSRSQRFDGGAGQIQVVTHDASVGSLGVAVVVGMMIGGLIVAAVVARKSKRARLGLPSSAAPAIL